MIEKVQLKFKTFSVSPAFVLTFYAKFPSDGAVVNALFGLYDLASFDFHVHCHLFLCVIK